MGKWIVVVLLGFIIIGCQAEPQRSSLQAADAATRTPKTTAVPTDSAAMPALVGRLILLQGFGMVAYDFDGTLTPIAASGVDRIMLAPNQSVLLYNLPNETDSPLYSIQLDTLERRLVQPLYFGRWSSSGWSPDNRWIVLHTIGNPPQVVNVFGAGKFDLPLMSADTDYIWLTDNSLLMVEREVRRLTDPPTVEFETLYRFDIATGQLETPALALDNLHGDAAALEAAINGLGFYYAPRPPSPPRAQPVGITGPSLPICATWQVIHEDVEFYSVPNRFQLSEMHALTDGSLLFLEWWTEDCRVQIPQIALKRVRFDQPATTVAEGLFSVLALGRPNPSEIPPHFAVSPDERFVAWIGGTLEMGETSVHVSNLQTGESHLLLLETKADSDTHFVEAQLYRGVYWVQ